METSACRALRAARWPNSFLSVNPQVFIGAFTPYSFVLISGMMELQHVKALSIGGSASETDGTRIFDGSSEDEVKYRAGATAY